MVALGMVLVSALAVGPLFDRLLVLQRCDAPEQWEASGRPCADFWRPNGREYGPDRLSSELAALVAIVSWVLWTPRWIEAHAGAMRLLWGLRLLVLCDAAVLARVLLSE